MRRTARTLIVAFGCLAGLTIVSNASAGNFDAELMHCVGEDPGICQPATVGQSYTLTIYLLPRDGGRGEDFTCARYHVSSGDLPPGLAISDDAAMVSGTPTQAGHYSFFLTVTYDRFATCPFKNPSDDSFVIDVSPGAAPPPPPPAPSPPPPPPPPTVSVTTASLPDANIDQPYTSPGLTATGATVTSWTLAAGTLPSGLNLGTNGVISGTPTQSGTFPIKVRANATGASATKDLSLFVLAPLGIQTLTNRTPPETGLTAKRLVNQALLTGVTAVGGRAPYTFSAEGDLPPGITVDPASGKISGSGTTAGRYAFTETVTDSTGATASVPWTVTIVPLLDFTKGKVLPLGRLSKRYSARIPLTGKDAATAELAMAGRIPPGLELDDTGRLVGTLLRTGTFTIRVYAFSGAGAPISKQFTIRVRP